MVGIWLPPVTRIPFSSAGGASSRLQLPESPGPLHCKSVRLVIPISADLAPQCADMCHLHATIPNALCSPNTNLQVKISRKLALQVAKLMVSQNFAPSLFQLAIFVVYALVHDVNSVGIIFTSIALVNMIRQSFAILPFIFSTLQTSSATLTDIKKYLLLPEIDPKTEAGEGGRGEIQLGQVSLRWGKEADPVLSGVELSVLPGELAMVVGKVGSGKTSLLNAILQEGEVRGQLHVGGRVAYVPQQAWITNATLQDNVLFGKPHSAAYDEAIHVCDLQADLQTLPDGDQTEIGEKGINVSGGQKQRISLARAVYQVSFHGPPVGTRRSSALHSQQPVRPPPPPDGSLGCGTELNLIC